MSWPQEGAGGRDRGARVPRQHRRDLWVTSTGQPGPVHRLSFGDDTAVSGSAFASDSQWAHWFTDHDVYGAGDLIAAPASGGAPSLLGRGAGRPGRAVLRASDLSAGAAESTPLATYVDPNFYLTHAQDQVVFSFDDGTRAAGIYVAPLPR